MWKEKRDGKWRYFERYEDPRSGKQKRVSVTLDKANDKQANKLLNAKITELTKIIGDYTIDDVAKAYIADMKMSVSPVTCARNESAINMVSEILGGYNLISKLTAGYIKQQLIASGKRPRTCNELIRRLGTFIRWAYRNDYIESTECVDKLTRFRDVPVRERIQDKFLNSTELSALLAGMTDEGNRLVTEFLALSGLRIGEFIALDDSDVTDVISVTKSYSVTLNELTPGKNQSSCREVWIQPELADCIKRLRKFMQIRKMAAGVPFCQYFCISRKGERFQYGAYLKYFREHTERIVGRTLSPHALRHTHASLLMEQGYPIESISRRLGHENSKITKQIYLHVTEGIKKRDIEMISNISLLPPKCPQKGISAS